MALVDTSTGEVVPTLDSLEAVIERGLASFVEVGQALMTIRDERLYRADHDTFEAYCLERWGIGRAHSYRLIESAEIVGALSPIGDTPKPATESQARALRPLKDEPQKMAEAMERAADSTGGKVTAEAIGEAVADLVASSEQKRQDKAELRSLMDEINPPGFDAAENQRQVQLRGRFSALCADLSNFGQVDEVIDDLRRGSRPDRFLQRATDAHAWLTRFLEHWEY